jgi:hypothetical protein
VEEKRGLSLRAQLANVKRPSAAITAPPSTSGTAGKSKSRLKKTSNAQVGGPKAGKRLTAKTTPNAIAIWAAADTVELR